MNSALILCAGLGTRMKPLTLNTPKPMLPVLEKPLLHYHLEKLANTNIQRVVINTFWCGEKIIESVGNGDQFGVEVVYSKEQPLMETAGGIKQAIPLLNNETFMVINGDIWCDIDFAKVQHPPTSMLANLVMTDNPTHHPNGDFTINDGILTLAESQRKTFTGIAIYHRDFFEPISLTPGPLSPWFKHWIEQSKVAGQYHSGNWCDVGTPERLSKLERDLQS
jgi:MurNAc alpha-1-phosphate uridylyltransferase